MERRAKKNKSDLGLRVQVKLVVDISVRWSISLWVSVLYLCVKAAICSLDQLKETIMTIRDAMVLVGAALLPAWRGTLHLHRGVVTNAI